MNETEARAAEPQIIEEGARLAQLRGDHATAAAERQCAHVLYVAIGATGHAERLAKELVNAAERGATGHPQRIEKQRES